MILAAGVGSRLDPLTRRVPKPMVPIINRPVMGHIVELLARYGFDEIYCNTHYLAPHIENYFASHPPRSARMHFHREQELIGTAGSLKRIQQKTGFFGGDESFLVIGGDDLTSIDLGQMLDFHQSHNALATIGLTEVEDPSQFGVVVLNPDNSIARFVEKPPPGTAPSNLVNIGVYLFDCKIFDLIPPGQFYDFGKNLFPMLQHSEQPFFGYKTREFWRDVGNIREYRACHHDFFDGTLELTPQEPQVSDGLWIGPGAQIDATAELIAPCVIGEGCIIGPNARVGEESVLGKGCKIGEGATVLNSILWDGAQVEAGTHVQGALIGYDCRVASNAGVFDAVVVPSESPGG